jgi:cytochrome c553
MLKTFLLACSLCVMCVGGVNAAETEREPFDDRYCTTCHGADGRGNEGVQAPRLAGMEPWYLRR